MLLSKRIAFFEIDRCATQSLFGLLSPWPFGDT